MTNLETVRPTSGDVVELILDDHRRFEDLLRLCRRTDTDRGEARRSLAETLVSHARSEEEQVYPTLRKQDAISDHEEEHGEEEHAEINEALLAFLQVENTEGDEFDEKLEELATVVNHHSNEEEQTILNPARDDVDADKRAALGAAWIERRNELLDEGCASAAQVAALLHEAVSDGVLAPEDAREKAEEIKQDAKDEAEEIEESAKAAAAG